MIFFLNEGGKTCIDLKKWVVRTAVRGGCRPLLYLSSPGNLSLWRFRVLTLNSRQFNFLKVNRKIFPALSANSTVACSRLSGSPLTEGLEQAILFGS